MGGCYWLCLYQRGKHCLELSVHWLLFPQPSPLQLDSLADGEVARSIPRLPGSLGKHFICLPIPLFFCCTSFGCGHVPSLPLLSPAGWWKCHSGIWELCWVLHYWALAAADDETSRAGVMGWLVTFSPAGARWSVHLRKQPVQTINHPPLFLSVPSSRLAQFWCTSLFFFFCAGRSACSHRLGLALLSSSSSAPSANTC